MPDERITATDAAVDIIARIEDVAEVLAQMSLELSRPARFTRSVFEQVTLTVVMIVVLGMGKIVWDASQELEIIVRQIGPHFEMPAHPAAALALERLKVESSYLKEEQVDMRSDVEFLERLCGPFRKGEK